MELKGKKGDFDYAQSPKHLPENLRNPNGADRCLSGADRSLRGADRCLSGAEGSGYKHTEIGVIPEDWVVRKLGSFCYITKLAGFEYSKYFNSYKDEGEIIVVRGTNITNNELDLSDIKTIPKKTSDFLIRSKLFRNDLVFAYVGTIGPIYQIIQDDKYHLGPNTAKIRIEDKDVSSNFIYNYFLSKNIKREINERMSVGAQPSLSMTKIRDFNIICPPLPEQQKIAEALSDTDALIQSLKKLIAKKKDIKQGAMQELLSGKRRLEGFDGEWENVKLGEKIDIRKGEMITSATVKAGNIPVIAGGKSPAYYHNVANRLNKTITISASGASAGFVWLHNYPIFASDCSTIEESTNYDIRFIYYYLLNNQQLIYASQTGGAQPHIHPKDIQPMIFSFPEMKEQTRIAQILSDMDAEIEALEKQLQKTELLKQGMMQELLTGRIRLIKPQAEKLEMVAEPKQNYKTH